LWSHVQTVSYRVNPSSLWSPRALIPFFSLVINHIARNHSRKGFRVPSKIVPELELAQHIAGQVRAEPVRAGRNITHMPFMPDPRTFYPTVYSLTRLLIMPSLWNESFGLVAAEAMLNGIPVLASNRGALTETVGGSGTRRGCEFFDNYQNR
jgi:glycosyltransferase involved in cell wall biosynthesis